MKYIELNSPTPAGNLACDEAILDACEAGQLPDVLRFWESPQYFVVVGYANQAAREANLEACQAARIPVLRRCTGGGTVLQGPGCLNYSLFLRIEGSPALRTIAETNQFILDHHQRAIQSLVKGDVGVQGCSDLTLGHLKVSGNAQRRKRDYLIFHGTFLLNFDLPLIEKYLRMPSKEPDYREHRPHTEFLTNLNISAAYAKSALRKVWDANEPIQDLLLPQLPELEEKYSGDAWNFKF